MDNNSNKCISGIPLNIDPIHFCEPSNSKIYYHYTSMEKMWLIIDGEGLRATQAGFSNDNEEIQMGIKVVKEICKELFKGKDNEMMDFIDSISRNTLDSYIVCFCDKDDKLSQWRAYCNEGGVSLGFAFDDTQPNYYYSNRKGYRSTGTKCQIYPVFYYNYNAECENCSVCLTYDQLKEIINKKIIFIGDNQAKKQAILELIPYIKHCGFCEEEEHRLLIDNPLDYAMHNTTFKSDDVVEYFDKNGKRSPYISIKFRGDISHQDIPVRVFCNKSHFENIKKKIDNIIKKYNITVKDNKKINLKDRIIHVQSNDNKIIIGEGDVCSQKLLFNILDRINFQAPEKEIIPIWCDGHLPIRTITVAPSLDQERQISMIKHFCTHKHFWMKYITVMGSKIPYRSY